MYFQNSVVRFIVMFYLFWHKNYKHFLQEKPILAVIVGIHDFVRLDEEDIVLYTVDVAVSFVLSGLHA